ncbi:oligopeptide transport system permease protein OppB [Clostridium tepidiprofundi DSM 19306]|uniref:Oligopeptide transport system permease protein OppB n=1 Tax=Clostridium tepidiprofundi DSM 19306 TaxID=1121338 RepID=A0A151B7S7_9CLOT|nr:ABC transporter permease [Clostridium tepidiprofundi]KYH36001.1 oligopeptide transport system permease protein OppB [Clostridium tepidiprofundi DSM 19306]
MTVYILKRLVASIVTLFIVVTATFFLMHQMPGGPFDSDKPLPPKIKANMEKKYGLDKPIGQQYALYMKGILHGDLGDSMKYEGMTVNYVIGYSFKASAKLGAACVVFALLFGLFLGINAALNQGKWPDGVNMVLSTIGVVVPSFVLATFLIYVFAVKLHIFNAIGFSSPKDYVLPVISLAGFPLATIARLSRSSMLDVIRQDYIRTAKAKGLSRNMIIYKHALRNALIPVVTYLGPLIAAILTGSFIVESLFGIPGLGREFVTSISNRDFPTILGVTVFYSAFLVLCNLIVDILYVYIDPRIKLEG